MQPTIENDIVYDLKIGEKEATAPLPGIPRIRFSTRRRAVGLSPESVALSLDVSTKDLSAWQAGTSQPTIKQYADLCRLLVIHPNELQLVESSVAVQKQAKASKTPRQGKRRTTASETQKTATSVAEPSPIQSLIERLDKQSTEAQTAAEKTIAVFLGERIVSDSLREEMVRMAKANLYAGGTYDRWCFDLRFATKIAAEETERSEAEAKRKAEETARLAAEADEQSEVTEAESANNAEDENDATD